ncbi:hypothetical protein C8Q79DRAFT_963533 [Trametes meyenii]|nr:hypothetical protein C8Q79DRAFT_963533 [Trametes meyenii]
MRFCAMSSSAPILRLLTASHCPMSPQGSGRMWLDSHIDAFAVAERYKGRSPSYCRQPPTALSPQRHRSFTLVASMVELTLTRRQATVPLHTPDEWLARDHDVETSVFLLAEPSLACSSRWSLVWRVGGATESEMTAWRSISANPCSQLVDLGEPRQYVYHGPMTKTAIDQGRRYTLLANTSLAERKSIEHLAKKVDVTTAVSGESSPFAIHNSEAWIKSLLNSMVTSNMILDEQLRVLYCSLQQ